jgi:glycosyltransferase involved in cell wall biosynthesis
VRIVHVINTMHPSDGGPPTMVAHLASEQARLGHQVHVLSYALGENNADARGTLRLVDGGDKVIAHALKRDRVEKFHARRASAALRRLLPGTNIVHIHGVWPAITWACGRVCRKSAMPYCVLAHGSLNDWTLAQSKWKKNLMIAAITRRFTQGAAFVQATSAYEADCLRQRQLAQRIELIPAGVDWPSVETLPPRGQFRAARPELGADPFVLFLARLHPGKGLDIAIDAIKLVRQRGRAVRLVVAGPDSGSEAEARAQAEQLGVRDAVHFVGPLYGPEKRSAMVDASCFVMPSQGESFGLSIAEAMACACPVVISPECHFEQVDQSGAGIITPRSAQANADAIERLLADPALARQMGERGRRLVRSQFTWSRCAEQCLEAYARHTR